MPKFKPFVKNSPAEQAIRTSDRTAATLRNRMKSIFVPTGTRLIRRIFFIPYNGSFFGRLRCSHVTTIRRVTMIAVNIEVSRPIASVTAKPLIGPDPN